MNVRLWLAVVLAVFATACEAFDESLIDPVRPDAGPDCELHVPPPRPAGADSEGVPELLYAIHRANFDAGDAWRTIGYDLDDLCTVEPNLRIECLAPHAMAIPEIDGEAGTDNSFGHNVMPIILAGRPDFVPNAINGQAMGLGAIILRLNGWNGEPNDPRVSVAFIQSVFGSNERLVGFTTVEPRGTLLFVDGVERRTPAWDGTDYFWARPDSFLGDDLTRPLVLDDNAWVADGTLVMTLPSRFPLILGGNMTQARFTLTDGVLTAELDPDRRTIRHTVLAGRWDADDILATIERAGVCQGTTDYGALSTLLRLAVDVRTTPGTGTGVDTECEALSVGLEFQEGVTATLMGAIEAFPNPSPCDDPPDGGVPDAGVDAGVDGG